MNPIKQVLILSLCFALAPSESWSQKNDSKPVGSKPTETESSSNRSAPQAKEPDPLKLLKAVATERSKLPSSTMTFDLKMLIGDQKFQAIYNADYSAGNYRFTGKDEDGDQVYIFDGTKILSYRHDCADIFAPDKSPGGYLFDPQSLGLTATLFPNQSLRKVLGFDEAKSVALDGSEKINGFPCWKVKVLDKYDQTLTFWINNQEKHRVYKQLYEYKEVRREVLCEFDKNIADGMIPSRVKTQEWYGKEKMSSRDTTIVSFKKADFHDNDFNLFGLGMKIGTPVSDIRIHQRIGYWDGEKLTEGLPRKDK